MATGLLTLNPDQVLRLRLASLLLAGDFGRVPASRANPASIAMWFGAMQAQDYASGLWSFGVRLPGWNRSEVEAAVANGEVLRTWTQRGTIHFIAAQDARWMLTVCGQRVLQRSAKRREQLGISDKDVDVALGVLTERLAGGQGLTRAEIVSAFAEHDLDAAGPRAYHLLWFASQSGLTCIGPNRGKQQTYVLLADFAPEQRPLSGDDALHELALRYFRSHGPASVKDFAGWTGLTMRDCRRGVELAGDQLRQIECAGVTMIAAADLLDRVGSDSSESSDLHLLAPYDEFLLGIKDRSLPVPPEFADRIIPGNNGVFQATVVREGRVAGIWKRTERPKRVDITVTPFDKSDSNLLDDLAPVMARYADYLGKPCAARRAD